MENGLADTVRSLNVFDGLALLIALGLVGVGFLIGTAGTSDGGGTIPVELTVTPDNDTRGLPPGTTKTFPLYINNPTDHGVRVASISAGASNSTPGGCPAGTMTSVPVDGPVGFIRPRGIRTYDVSVTMAADANNSCKDQAFTLPLTVTLVSAAGDRHFTFGSS